MDAQQLYEATLLGAAPGFLIRDQDRKCGDCLTRVAVGTSSEVLRTAYRAPKTNAICEHFSESMRRDCLDHLLILGERNLCHVVKEDVTYFNCVRRHEKIGQRILEGTMSVPEKPQRGKMIAFPVLSGLHDDNRLAG